MYDKMTLTKEIFKQKFMERFFVSTWHVSKERKNNNHQGRMKDKRKRKREREKEKRRTRRRRQWKQRSKNEGEKPVNICRGFEVHVLSTQI
jgi:hypothetical protein